MTALPGQSRDYDRTDFARDIYTLDAEDPAKRAKGASFRSRPRPEPACDAATCSPSSPPTARATSTTASSSAIPPDAPQHRLETWLDVLDREYLATFIADGGATVKIAVAEAAERQRLAQRLAVRCHERGYLPVRVDSGKARAHMPQDLFHGLASRVDWRQLATAARARPCSGTRLRGGWHRHGHAAPARHRRPERGPQPAGDPGGAAPGVAESGARGFRHDAGFSHRDVPPLPGRMPTRGLRLSVPAHPRLAEWREHPHRPGAPVFAEHAHQPHHGALLHRIRPVLGEGDGPYGHGAASSTRRGSRCLGIRRTAPATTPAP